MTHLASFWPWTWKKDVSINKSTFHHPQFQPARYKGQIVSQKSKLLRDISTVHYLYPIEQI